MSSSDESLENVFNTSSASQDSSGSWAVAYPPRREAGKLGRRIDLETNHFLVQLNQEMVIYHYDVGMLLQHRNELLDLTKNPKGLLASEARALCIWAYKKLFEEEPHNKVFCNRFSCAYDSRANMFTVKKLDLGPSNSYVAKIHTVDNRILSVTVKPCDTFQLRIKDIIQALCTYSKNYDRSTLQALDVMTSMKLIIKNQYYGYGNCFYQQTDQRTFIGNGLELLDGLFKSLRPVKGFGGGPYVMTMNVESKKGPFYARGLLLDSVIDELRLQDVPHKPLAPADVFRLKRRFKGVKVRAVHTRHTFRVTDVLGETALSKRFEESPGNEMSVLQYFQKRYNITLRYPNLPLVAKGKSCFPMELLEVLGGQRVSLSQLTENNQREIIYNSAVPPYQRRLDILRKCAELGLTGAPDDRFGQAFGIKLSPDMLKLAGRVLNNPVVQYASDGQNQGTVEVKNGVWDMRNQGVFLSAQINNWAVANMSAVGKRDVDQFLQRLTWKAQEMKVNMRKQYAKYREFKAIDMAELGGYFETLARVENVTFVLCLLPNAGDDIRSGIKYAGEVVQGLATQCVRERTVRKFFKDSRGADTLLLQLMLKVNAKNGGVNNEVKPQGPIAAKWLRKGVMFMGFDVNHPPPLSRAEIGSGKKPAEPSVVGAVCNSGRSMFDYRMQYKLQDARQESISHAIMVDVVKNFLKEYQHNNGELPSNVIVYRDGVAESQFAMVVETELRFIREAFWKYSQGYSPKLTLLVVQKRHHTRFFKTDMRPNDKCTFQNIPAGTVVDVGPVNPVLFDFFLCSHVGIQGTSKPAQYTVLYDDNNFDSDSVQMLTYLLCQTYQKCNRSVSLPAPVYHAHHAATRGKELLLAVLNNRNSKGKFGRPEEHMQLEQLEKKINLHGNVSSQMVWA